ncbi:MAG: putative mycofactocin radical SAM maturase MftC [Syntrophomonadaceae bacterium]|nr:putative mycofactocin radical SAM maturase MftC [Bacillota bacterium]
MEEMDRELRDITLSDLRSPLFFAWHMTNKCNLRCIHCLWESGPDASWPGELVEAEALLVCRQLIDFQIPYVAFSGGEPLLHPAFWPVCELLAEKGIEVKIESNGQLVDDDTAKRLASLNLRSIQISIDGTTQDAYSKMRPGAQLAQALEAVTKLVKRGVSTEIVYVPAKFNFYEAEKLIDLAVELKVKAFYTGKTMFIGRAVKNWDLLGLEEEENEKLSRLLEKKAAEYQDKMTILYYPYSVTDELNYRLKHPAASLLLMANGKVKLIGSMPFVCGDVRKHNLTEIWQRYIKAWAHPEVIEYANSTLETPALLAGANDFVELHL